MTRFQVCRAEFWQISGSRRANVDKLSIEIEEENSTEVLSDYEADEAVVVIEKVEQVVRARTHTLSVAHIHIFSRIHTHTLSHTHIHAHTHTRIHTVRPMRPWWLSRMLRGLCTHTLSLFLSLRTHTHIHTLSLSRAHTYSLSLTHSHTQTHTYTQTPMYTHT